MEKEIQRVIRGIQNSDLSDNEAAHKIRRLIRKASRMSWAAGADYGYFEASQVDWDRSRSHPEKPINDTFDKTFHEIMYKHGTQPNNKETARHD